MDTRCIHVTRKGSRCSFRSKQNGYCLKHVKESCPICFETIQSGDKHTLSCEHKFHRQCMVQWYVESNVCPICRAEQKDELLEFKEKVKENMRQLYKDAIDSSDREIERLRRILNRGQYTSFGNIS